MYMIVHHFDDEIRLGDHLFAVSFSVPGVSSIYGSGYKAFENTFYPTEGVYMRIYSSRKDGLKMLASLSISFEDPFNL